MRHDQHAHLNEYVRMIADDLRLKDTHVELKRDDTTGFMNGESQSAYGRNGLWLWINPALALDLVQLRQTVVHELLHHHFNPMRDVFLRVYGHEPDTDDTLVGALYRLFQERMESCLDVCASIMADHLPMMDPFPEADD